MLEVKGVNTHYGKLQAVRDASLTVNKGEIVFVVGPNGAGKSTFVRTIAGLNKPTSGSIVFENRPIGALPPDEITRAGIAFVPEGRHIFSSLTVLENLLIGQTIHPVDRTAREDLERVMNLFPLLRERQKRGGGKLSGGEQQMLAIARSLLCKPRLLIIDEPSLGLAPLVVKKVYETITHLRLNEGVTFLIIEQSAAIAKKYADRIAMMREGRFVMTREAGEIQDLDVTVSDYFGTAKNPH